MIAFLDKTTLTEDDTTSTGIPGSRQPMHIVAVNAHFLSFQAHQFYLCLNFSAYTKFCSDRASLCSPFVKKNFQLIQNMQSLVRANQAISLYLQFSKTFTALRKHCVNESPIYSHYGHDFKTVFKSKYSKYLHIENNDQVLAFDKTLQTQLLRPTAMLHFQLQNKKGSTIAFIKNI